MHAIDYLALSLFLAAHIGTTICIGLWLNKMARREVSSAVKNVAEGLGDQFPILKSGSLTGMVQGFLRPQGGQENGQKATEDAERF